MASLALQTGAMGLVSMTMKVAMPSFMVMWTLIVLPLQTKIFYWSKKREIEWTLLSY